MNRGFHRVSLGEVDLYIDAVAISNPFDDVIGFLGQSTGVDGKYPQVGIDAPGHVQNDHPLGLKTGAARDPGMPALKRPGDDRLRLFWVELDGQLARFIFI